MEPLKNFSEQKKQIISHLEKLLHWVREGERLDLDVEDTERKILDVIEGVKSEKIKVALVGAFSEGKTTVAASWLGKVVENMKIDPLESSDSIEIYRPEGFEDNCEIVDTPGLFGSKEKVEEDSAGIKYSDITKKYVSEAHLVLYVLNPVNSIKDSHAETIKWLFRDLEKLDSTIFIINHFDSVCDIEDDEDYEEMFKIKKQAVIDRLKAIIGLDIIEENKLKIIGISANPFNRGVENWLSNKELYLKLSRINKLQDLTESFLKSSKETLVKKQSHSIISESIIKQSKQADEIYSLYEKQLKSRDEALSDIDKEILNTKSKFNENKIRLREDITSYFDGMLLQLNAVDLGTFQEFYTRNIGEDGINIESEMNTLFDRYAESTNSSIITLDNKINTEFDFRDSLDKSFLQSHAKNGIKVLSKMGINNTTVLASRNLLRGGLGKVGIKAGMKFKPWGAAKFAKGLNGGLAFIAVAFEAWETYDLHKKNKKLEESKKELTKYLNTYKAHLLSYVNDDESFIKNFAPSFENTLKSREALSEEVTDFQYKSEKIREWYKKSDSIINVEFEEI
ncbi:LeoA/HP0731 family dynamin-like GTPase [Flavobacterium taihuense]|uniref:Dynamin family protein n=1 Tax=Flavobacterium taihuense TaxID=2857508 RepID=A0ABS6Y073_9FLAO|nr:LeoA/HP0731 family dynamin-like GTPase [Flavobacterium taihuense]MBW4362297.1 dynamin family protein [Flavobacterium taihuense]